MAEPRFAIVVTTIGGGEFLDIYARKIAEEGLLERTTMVVIPDRKTPAALSEAVSRARATGLRIDCPDLDTQERFLSGLGAIGEFIPWNSDARRNIGFLRAYESGADVIVAIDDDNLCELPGPWLARHGIVAGPAERRLVIESASGWYNPCALLESDPPGIFPRGYPFAQRGAAPPLNQSCPIHEVHEFNKLHVVHTTTSQVKQSTRELSGFGLIERWFHMPSELIL